MRRFSVNVLVVLLALTFLALGARPLQGALVVGNLNSAFTGLTALQFSQQRGAVSFTLGPGFVAASLDSVGFSLGAFASGVTASAYLAADSGGSPGASVMSLGSQPVPQAFGTVSFTPASSYILQPGSTYWVVLSRFSASGDVQWITTNGSTPDAGSNPAASMVGNLFSGNSGGSWSVIEDTEGLTYKMAVNATAVPEPAVAGLLVGGVLVFGLRRKRRRA